MASTDALPIPIKNTAFRVTFPIIDAFGDLVTGATIDSGLASGSGKALLGKDGASAVNSTNSVTEITGMLGVYYLDITSGEMNYDSLAITVRTTTTDAKNVVMVLYPAEDTELRCNLKEILGSSSAATNLKNTALTTISGTVVSDAGNTATTFKTDLTESSTDYYGDASSGGCVLVFISGANNQYQARRVTSFNASTDFITVESAFDAAPTASDTFVLIGRIEI